MIPRTITEKLHYFTEKYPVVTLTGPRQSGKSTLLRNSFPAFRYVSLEDPDVLLMAETDPRLFLKNHTAGTIIDEAQRFPGLFSYLQSHIDSVNREGMYILSGSHNFLLMEKISQSLAGRTAILKLLPFSYQELINVNIVVPSCENLIFKGAYPRIFDKNLKPGEFYPFYIQTYIEKDIWQIKNVSDISLFIRFVKLCAGRIGQLLNLSSLANECGISQPTARAWLTLLETSYIVYLLKPYHVSYNKRLVKTPKLYFYDTGLACSLLGLQNEDQYHTHYLKGSLFENWAIMEYQKNCLNHAREPQIWFWRDNTGNEIDLLIETDGKIAAVEFKSGLTAGPDYFRGLSYWQAMTGCTADTMFVVYGGDNSMHAKNGTLLAWKDWAVKFNHTD